MLHVPTLSDFRWRLRSDTSRPAAFHGATVTPGNNTKGSWVQLLAGAAVLHDVFGVLINANNASQGGQITDALMDVGIDEAGGSSYSTLIPDLMVGQASNFNAGGGVWYYFPLRIPEGSSIAVRISMNNASTYNVGVHVTLYGQPRHPEAVRVGSYVDAFGAVGASSRGTIITPGTTSEGAWTQLGSALTRDCWWWQFGYGAADTVQSNTALLVDLGAGDGSNKRELISDAYVYARSNESISHGPVMAGCMSLVASGESVYGRAQSSGSPETDPHMMAYGVGG